MHPRKEDRDHAFEHSRLERARFERHVGRIHFVPAHRVVLNRIRIVPATYHYRRTVFYDVYGWAPRLELSELVYVNAWGTRSGADDLFRRLREGGPLR